MQQLSCIVFFRGSSLVGGGWQLGFNESKVKKDHKSLF
jgi:hypothetical protein